MEYSANYVSASSPTGAATRKVALRLKGKPREGQEAAHLSVVLDTSDSMNDGNKLETCKTSISFILDLMRDTDAVSLVTFDEVSRVVSPLMATTAEKKTNFRTLVNSVHTDGCTNMSAGLLEAKGLLEAPPTGGEAGRKQGMLLLTDGHANRGVYRPDDLFTIIKAMMDARPDLTVHTIGYGFDHNVEMLSKIAEWTGGTYSVVKNLEDVATVFGSVLGSMVSTTAQNVRVTLPEGFKLLSQNQTEKDAEARTVVRVGDIQSEVSSILLLEVPADSTAPLRISGVDLLTHEPIVAEIPIEPPQELSEEDARNLDLAFLRVEIVDLMKEVQSGTARGTTYPNREAILAKLDTFEARLATAPASLAGMVGLMKCDIRLMRDILTGRSRDVAADTSMLSQHANVWTTQRGVTCGVAAPAAAECSPFVSRVASNYVGLMRASSSQAAPPARDPNSNTYDSDNEDPNVYSAHATHMRRQNAVHFAPPSTPPRSPPMTPVAALPPPPLARSPTNS